MTSPGVYVVAFSSDAGSAAGALESAPVQLASMEELLSVRPELKLDGRRPDARALTARLAAFWLPETVVYVGLATSLRSRVGAYYRTRLGAKRPHAGGWWLKTLGVLDELWVHYAPTPDFECAEKRMLRAFADGVAREARAALYDRERVMPFAYLRGHDNLVKRHGIIGATGDLPGPKD